MNIFNSFNDGLLARSEERERTKKKNKPKRTIKLQWPNINENSDWMEEDWSDENKIVLKYI